MSNVSLVWSTPDAEKLVAYMARVSNPKFQDKEDIAGLLKYCVNNHHWSIFEMVNAVFEINTTRDIARQILRHRSFSFQEFSQRYADVRDLGSFELREARMQDTKNRQNSIPSTDFTLEDMWHIKQNMVLSQVQEAYSWAIDNGIAKEQARAVLPEGLTPSRMYMNGTLRSWMHYVKLRSGNGTQKEHQDVAVQIGEICAELFPVSWKALNGDTK
jgi:thymidylate synthase (FAD)